MLGLQILFAGRGGRFSGPAPGSPGAASYPGPPVDLGDVIDGLVRHTALEGFVSQKARSESCTCRCSMTSSVVSFSKSDRVRVSMPSSMELTASSWRVQSCCQWPSLRRWPSSGSQTLIGVNELIKRPFGVFDDHIVQRRLKAGAGFAGHIVGDLVQRVAQGNLGCHLGDGIAGSLGASAEERDTRGLTSMTA